MGRILTTSVFVLLTLATGSAAYEALSDVIAAPSLRTSLVLGYLALKVTVIAAFTAFVFMRDEPKRKSRELVAFVACAGAIFAAIPLQPPRESAETGVILAGELLSIASCVWLLIAAMTLGKCFGVLPEARGLVTRGPYSVVRHPVYLGELGAFTGLVVASPTTVNAIAVIVFISACTVRMRLEEAALSREFPEYAAYAARTPRFIPRLRLRERIAPAPDAPLPGEAT